MSSFAGHGSDSRIWTEIFESIRERILCSRSSHSDGVGPAGLRGTGGRRVHAGELWSYLV